MKEKAAIANWQKISESTSWQNMKKPFRPSKAALKRFSPTKKDGRRPRPMSLRWEIERQSYLDIKRGLEAKWLKNKSILQKYFALDGLNCSFQAKLSRLEELAIKNIAENVWFKSKCNNLSFFPCHFLPGFCNYERACRMETFAFKYYC